MNINNIDLKIEKVNFWASSLKNKGGMRIGWISSIGNGTLDIIKKRKDNDDDFLYENFVSTIIFITDNDKNKIIKKLLELLVEELIPIKIMGV